MKKTKYTELAEGRRYKQIAWRDDTPRCQARYLDRLRLTPCEKPGEFDSPTLGGSWADLCKEHAEQFAPPACTIGYHRVPYCASCEMYEGMGPPHNASAACQSGGRNHCSCDVCF